MMTPDPASRVECPACFSAPGEPCTAPTATGRKPTTWFHLARVQRAEYPDDRKGSMPPKNVPAEWEDLQPGDRVEIVVEATLTKIEHAGDERGRYVILEYEVAPGDTYAIEVPRYGAPAVKVEVDRAWDGAAAR